ncbi:MAG: MJ0042-type zinc finger domain-containing protein [Devosia sp.]
MSSPDLQTAVIACPHCGTRYQVPQVTLGVAGREVQCAQCGQSWHAEAVDRPGDALFTPEQEKALDAAFEAEAREIVPTEAESAPRFRNEEHERTLAQIRAAIAPKAKAEAPPAPDPKVEKHARTALEKRLESVRRSLPMARFRRSARIIAFAVLALILIVGVVARYELVRAYPGLAGLYSAIGLGVNVVGLQFEDTRTLMSLRQGRNVVSVTARIRSVAGDTVSVPPVLVTLLDGSGAILFEWTVLPKAREMSPGEVLDFSTELNSPPAGAQKIRLSFTNTRSDAGLPRVE